MMLFSVDNLFVLFAFQHMQIDKSVYKVQEKREKKAK